MKKPMHPNSLPSVQNNVKTTTKRPGGITGKGFMPGQSGNPGGRPKKHPITEQYDKLMERLGTSLRRDPRKMTVAELIAIAQAQKAAQGNTAAAKEITDRIEGKAVEPVDVTADIVSLTAELPDIIRAARDRVRRAQGEENEGNDESGD